VAKFVATDYNITINGTPFSSSLAAVTLDISVEEQDTTSFGAAGGYRTRIGGLKDASVSLDFHQDFGASSVDATLFPLLGTQATVVIKPTAATVSATNPTYTFNALVTQYQPFASSVGDLATLSVSWPVSGAVTRGTGA
jgi:predicted secreted protein